MAGCLWTIDRQAASDLLSFIVDLLTHDHEPGHVSSRPAGLRDLARWCLVFADKRAAHWRNDPARNIC